MTRQARQFENGGLRELDLEQVCFVVMKARELTIQQGDAGPDGASGSDDQEEEVFTDRAFTSFRRELKAFINAMNEDEQAELVALFWIGRGDFSADQLDEATTEARERRDRPTSEYLLAKPQLADYLEDALAEFGLSCEDSERERY